MPYKDASDRSAYFAAYRERHRDEIQEKQRQRYHDEKNGTLAPRPRCRECGKILNRGNKHGYCKEHITRSEEKRKYRREWARAHPESGKAARQRRRQVPGYRRNEMLKEKYGITLEDFEEMALHQGGACAVCRRDPSEFRGDKNPSHKVLHVDHDHLTGQVRGLLCFFCNVAIGLFQDDAAVIMRAADYLKESR
jgi:Recombination endonuclease VII